MTAPPNWKRRRAAAAAMARNARRAVHCAAVGGIMLSPEVILSRCHIFHPTNAPVSPRGCSHSSGPGRAHLESQAQPALNKWRRHSLRNKPCMFFLFFFRLTLSENKCPRFYCLFVPPVMQVRNRRQAQYVNKTKPTAPEIELCFS